MGQRTESITQLVGELNELEHKHAPNQLFTEGRTELLRRRPRISIVGTRAPSPAGQRLAEHIAMAVVNASGVVVSGLAKGIDTIALTAAMRAGGDVIAVIGTPLSKTYPAENAALQANIKRDHLLVSQFPEGTATGRHSFPQRNRTMALLSEATVIIEAGATSGTQHQGWEAIRLGRILLLPETLFELRVPWAEEMLRFGAERYATASDIAALIDQRLPAAADIDATQDLVLAGG